MSSLPRISDTMLALLDALPYERGERRDGARLPGTESTRVALEERGLIATEVVKVGNFYKTFVELTDAGAVVKAKHNYLVGPNVAAAALEELTRGGGSNVELVFEQVGRS